MKVGIDATPLLGPRTGVGTYTANLVRELAVVGPDRVRVVATAFTARGAGGLASQLPAGVDVHSRPVPARALRAAWLRTAQPTAELLTGPVDVFHGTNFVVPPLRRARGVVTIHDLGYLRNPDTVARASLAYRDLVSLALRRGAVVCTPSRAVAAQVADAYAIPGSRIHPTPLGVEPSWLEMGHQKKGDRVEGEGVGAPDLPAAYLLAVGTLEPRKNLRLLLDVYRLAAARRVELPPLVLAGGQGWGDALDLGGLPERAVRFLGHVPFARLQQVVAQATALLFPSIDEGFGLPPLEALACGTAVVCSDLDVTREVLGDQAAFADPRSPEQFLAAVERSLDDPVGTPESRRQHAAGFTWSACAQATVRAYDHALAG